MNKYDILIIVAYFAAMLVVGVHASKKQKTSEDFFLGGRNLGSFSLTSLWVSGWIGGTAIIATSANAYDYGISAVWYIMAYSVGVVLFGYTMTDRVMEVGSRIKSVTLTDFMVSRYDEKTGFVTSVCTILSSLATVSAQFIAGASILATITGWDYNTSYLITATVITCYVATGGLMAVTLTDQVQMIMILVGIFFCVMLTGGRMSEESLSLSMLPAAAWNPGAMGWNSTIALAASSIMSYYTIMSSYTRIICAKDAKTAKKATLYSAVLITAICLGTTFVGLSARLMLDGSVSGSNVMAHMIVHVFPVGVKGLALVAILCAVMSTADISVLLVSTCVCNDIYHRHINTNAEDKTLKRFGVIGSFAAGVVSFFLGKISGNIMESIQLSFTIISAGLFLPVISAFFWRKACAKAAFTSVAASICVVVAWFICGKVLPLPIFELNAFWPAFAVSSVLFVIISAFHKQNETECDKSLLFMPLTAEQD